MVVSAKEFRLNSSSRLAISACPLNHPSGMLQVSGTQPLTQPRMALAACCKQVVVMPRTFASGSTGNLSGRALQRD